MLIKIIMLAVFFAVTVTVGVIYRKKSADVDGFVLGGRAVGAWLSAFAFGTAYFSAVVFVGYAGQFGWRFGISAVWIGLGNAFIGSLLPWIILGRRTRLMTKHLDSKTMPEFFGTRFNSNALKITASFIVFVFLIPYTASLYNGLSRLFEMAFQNDVVRIDFTVCIVIMAVLTAVYVIFGGYLGASVNNFIQGIVMIAGVIAVIGAMLSSKGGFTEATRSLARVAPEAMDAPADAYNTPGVFASFFGPLPIDLLGVVILTSLGTWGLPQMVGKFYSIKSEAAIKKGTIISTVFALVIAGGSYFLGAYGRLFTGAAIDTETGRMVYDNVIPVMLSGMSDVIIGLVIVLVLAASMSTLAALVMTSASTFTIDFLKGHIIKNMNDSRQLLIIRLLIVVFIVISAGIAIMQHTSSVTFIAQLMGVSWGALAGAFLAPFVYGLYWKKTTTAAVWVCFIFATTTMTLNIFFRGNFPVLLQSPINCGAFVMLAGLLIVPLVSALTKKPADKIVDNSFSCFNEKVTVPASKSLRE